VWYHPEAGRFLTRDPVRGRITAPQSLNPYTYCFNNPLKYVDPDGRDPIFCDEEKDPESVIHGSYVPQQIESRDPDDMNDEQGLIWFFGAMAFACAVVFGPVVAPFIPAFLTWLGPTILHFFATPFGSFLLGVIMGFLFFVLGLIASKALTEKTVKEMMEEMSPGECISLMEYLEKYCNEWGCKIKTITYNEDGTLTVTFSDDTQKKYKCVDGDWIEVPLESGGTGSPPESEPGDDSVSPGYLPSHVLVG
jgi:hypothetical protein